MTGKETVSESVFVLMLLEHLHKGSRSNRLEPGWKLSLMIGFVLLRQWEVYVSIREGGGQPMIFSAAFTPLKPLPA